MKIQIIGNYHRKNIHGLKLICNYLKYDLIFSEIINHDADIIMCPGYRKIKQKNVIYGPHFSVFPDHRSLGLKQGIYIQPSEWVKNLWSEMKNIPIKVFSFPVDTEIFDQKKNINNRQNVLVYYKHRNLEELNFIINALKIKNINPTIFEYGKYKEKDYIEALQDSKLMIVIDAHESQGFALEEAMSCNVPLLVWDVRSMNQELGTNYNDIPATSIPYWDKKCGEFFFEKENFEENYNKILKKINTYEPREYILENLSVQRCAENFLQLIKLL